MAAIDAASSFQVAIQHSEQEHFLLRVLAYQQTSPRHGHLQCLRIKRAMCRLCGKNRYRIDDLSLQSISSDITPVTSEERRLLFLSPCCSTICRHQGGPHTRRQTCQRKFASPLMRSRPKKDVAHRTTCQRGPSSH